MSNERTEKKAVAIVSLSIDPYLLKRLDEKADVEGRSRSQMIARMIKYYFIMTKELG